MGTAHRHCPPCCLAAPQPPAAATPTAAFPMQRATVRCALQLPHSPVGLLGWWDELRSCQQQWEQPTSSTAGLRPHRPRRHTAPARWAEPGAIGCPRRPLLIDLGVRERRKTSAQAFPLRSTASFWVWRLPPHSRGWPLDWLNELWMVQGS